MKPPLPKNETARLAALRQYQVLDTAPERSYDAITELASFICESPIALLSFVESERQWFKSKVGLGVNEAPREHSFCAHAIAQNSLLVVEDATTDERFSNNPFVRNDPNIRFYAGAPLITSDGHGVGSLCVIDRKPRKLSAAQISALEKLATLVITELDFRRVSQQLAQAMTNLKTVSGLVPICSHCKAIRNDENYWQTLEMYMCSHTEAMFSHGICPSCAKKHYPGFAFPKKESTS
jgi:GAF domain-containing protein